MKEQNATDKAGKMQEIIGRLKKHQKEFPNDAWCLTDVIEALTLLSNGLAQCIRDLERVESNSDFKVG